MRIVFRVDSSPTIGKGHMMRCLALAQQLIEYGATITFSCSELYPEDQQLLINSGIDVCYFGNTKYKNFDLLVIDNYEIDHVWGTSVRPSIKKILVIDDKADRLHDCDILVDQNFPYNRYEDLVPNHCSLLLGPKYALLREEFTKRRQNLIRKINEVRDILIFFGGGDNRVITSKAVSAISSLPYNVHTVGGLASVDMASAITSCDLAIGAGGISIWERMCLGIPSIVISVADNQEEICQELSDLDLIHYLGRQGEVTEEDIRLSLNKIAKDVAWRQKASKKGMEVVKGDGTKLVAKHILENI